MRKISIRKIIKSICFYSLFIFIFFIVLNLTACKACKEKTIPQENQIIDQKKEITFTSGRITSLDLIDKDAEKNTLDIDQAWIYRMYAILTPGKLPKKYQSITPIKCGTPVFNDFIKIKHQLKSETLEILKPYLVRPTHPMSIFNRRITTLTKASKRSKSSSMGLLYAQRPAQNSNNTWTYIDCQMNIRIWSIDSDPDKQKALKVQNLLNGYDMYNKFDNLMSREPLADDGHCIKISDVEKKKSCLIEAGGDSRLDIYVVGKEELEDEDSKENEFGITFGMCCPTSDNKITPAYILISKTLSTDKELGSTIAHELFHAFQFAFDQHEDDWWAEGTAVWAEDFIDNEWQSEHVYIEDAFDKGEFLLKTITINEGDHVYGIYIFPYYLSMKYQNEIIGNIWQGCENDQALDAIDNSIQDGFDEVFKKFALLNYDDTEQCLPEKYPEILNVLEHHKTDKYELEEGGEIEIDIEIDPLSAKYLTIINHIVDTDLTPHVLFKLNKFKISNKITLQAIINPGWPDAKVEDWTGRSERSFCLNDEEDEFDQVILVIGNSDRKVTYQPELKIKIDSEGCGEGGVNSQLTYKIITAHNYDTSSSSGTGIISKSDDRREIEVTINAQFDFKESFYDKNIKEISERYKLKRWNISSSRAVYKSNALYEHHDRRGLEKRRITKENYNGQAIKDLDYDSAEWLEIVFDANTGKAKYARLPVFGTAVKWEGVRVIEYLNRKDKGYEKGTRTEKEKFTQHFIPATNFFGNKEEIWEVGYLDATKVKSGDKINSMAGQGEYVQIDTKNNKQTLTCSWNLKRKKRPGKK